MQTEIVHGSSRASGPGQAPVKRAGLWYKWLLLFWLSGVIVLSFVTPRPVRGYGEEFRIFYYHVPAALVSFVAFAVNMVYSIRYLRGRNALDDLKAACAAELGVVFCALATATGALFARVVWGAYWNWDIRQTTIAVLLLIYGAYFALRAAVDAPERKSAFAAVYSLLAFVAVPTFGFIVPRLYESLHPSDTLIRGGKLGLTGWVALTFFASLAAFLTLFFWLFDLRWRTGRAELALQERSYE